MACGTAGVVFFTQALFSCQPAIAAESQRERARASLWQERRAAREKQANAVQVAWAGTKAPVTFKQAFDVPLRISNELPSLLRSRPDLPRWTNNLPLAWSEVQLVYSNQTSGPWAVLVEDLHNQQEAQRNMARVVGHFGGMGKTPLPVVLEGGTGPYDFTPFRRAGPPEAVKRAADHFFNKGWISGAQLAALTESVDIPFFGGENARLYESNIEAFYKVQPLLKQAESLISAERRRIDGEKESVFSEQAKKLDNDRRFYHSGTLSLTAYLETLRGLSSTLPGPSLKTFIDLVKTESRLDLKSVERERAELLEHLSRRLSADSLNELMSLATAYRAGEVTFGAMYGRIESEARRSRVRMGPAFRNYLRYLAQAETIDRRGLLTELAAYEETVALSLLGSQKERAVWDAEMMVSLADKLIHQSLMSVEWEAYLERWHRAETKQSSGLNRDSLFPFESFYQLAIERNEALAGQFAKVTSATPRSDRPAGLLIAGGFHTGGLVHALQSKGINVLVLAPKIKKINGEHYMAAFSRDRSPLDRILAGEKLFLATPQTLGQAPPSVPEAYRAEAAARSEYFTKLAAAFADWAKGRAEILLTNGKRLLVLMGSQASQMASRFKGYVLIDQGDQLAVLAKRATAFVVGLGMAISVVTAHKLAWDEQMDALNTVARRTVQTVKAVRRDKLPPPTPGGLPALLKENMGLRKQLMEAMDLGNNEEVYRLYDSLSERAEKLSLAARTASEQEFEQAWFLYSPETRGQLTSENLKNLRLELIEQGLTEFPDGHQKQLDGLVEQLVKGMFEGDAREGEVREKLKKSLTPGHFSVVLSKKHLSVYFEVLEEFKATGDPRTAEALSGLAEKISDSLNPLRTFHRLGSVVPMDGGRLALKTYLTPNQTGHVFMHEVIHLGGYQGWLQIPWTAEHFPHANQILFLFKTYGVEALSDPSLLSEMGLPIRQLFERGRRMGEKGELGFLILPGTSGDNFNYFSNAPLLNEATGVLSMSGENIDKLLDPYMAQRATGIVLAGVLAGRAATDTNFQPLATMRGLYESLHARLGPPTEDEKRFVDETTGFLSKVAKGIAGASNVKMVPKPGGGTWSAHRSKGYSCTIQYVPSDLYPRGPGTIQEEKEKVHSRGLAHILWAVEGSLHERHDLRDRSPLLTTEGFTPKIPAFHALWKALSFREMVAGLTDWHGRDVHSFSQMEDMAGAPKWMHELFQHRYHSGNEEYDRLLLSNLTSSEQFLDVLMYLRVHYQGGDLSLSDPRLANPQVHEALAESLGSMTSEGEEGWGRVLFDDGFFNKEGLHSAIAQRIWPAFDKLFEEDIKRKTLQKALAKMLQDRQQELNEQQRESFRQAIFENIDNQELKELLDFLEQLGVVEQEQLHKQAREEMTRKIEQFADNMQRDLLGEESSEPSGPGEGQETSGKGSPTQGSSQGPTSPGKEPQGTETRGAGSSSASSPASLKEAIEKLSENLSSLEKKLSDLGQKAQGLGEEARGLGNSAGSPQPPEGAEALVEDGKTIQEGVHGLQEQGRELARGVRDAREQTAKDAATLPAPGSAKTTEDALDLAGEQADALLGKLQEIQQKANDLADLAHRLAKSLNTGDATLPRDQAAALQDIAKELEKSLNALGRQGPAHALEKALEKAREAVKQLGKTIESIPAPSEPTGSPSEGTPSPRNTAEEESGTPTETPGQPKASGEARSGSVELKPFELDAAPTSSSLWGDAPPTAPSPVDKATKTIGFSGFGDNDFVDVKTIFPGLTEAESEEYIRWRAPHRKLLEEVVLVVPQLLHWTEGAEIRGGKFHGMLTNIIEAVTDGSGRAMVEPSKPLALKFTVLVDRSRSMGSEEKQQTVQFLLLVLAEIAFALQKSVPRGPEYRDLFQFTIGFHDTEEEHLITHRTSSQIRQKGISKESVIYKLLKSAEAQGGTELAEHVKKFHDDLSGFQSKGTQGDSPPRKILIVTSDMEVRDNQFNSLGKKLKENVDEKNARRKVLTILVPTGNNDYATQLKVSVGNAGIVLDAKPYKSLLRNILTVFAAGLDPKVSVNPETMARVGLEKLQRQLLPRAMSGWPGLRHLYGWLTGRGWYHTAVVTAAVVESVAAIGLGALFGWDGMGQFLFFAGLHLVGDLSRWETNANGKPRLVSAGRAGPWQLVFFGFLGVLFHITAPWVAAVLLPGLTELTFAGVPLLAAGSAVGVHALYNLFTPWVLGMSGFSRDLKPFGDYKNFFIRERGGLEYLVYKDDIEELQWQRAPDPARPGVSVPQEPMENIPDNEQTLKEILKRNFISGAIYMLKSEDGRRWFRPGSGADMEYWEQDDQDEWRRKETFSRGKRPQLNRMDSDGRAHFANGETALAWSWISEQPETLLIRENGGTDKPVTGWNGDKPRTLELKKISDDVILAFSADELKPSLFRLVRQGDGWIVAESFLLDFKERRENFVGLIGPTGVGKEKFLKGFGQMMNLPVDILSGHDKMQGDELLYETQIGRPDPGRQTETPSVVARALYHGGIGVLDEEKMVRPVPKDALLSVLANGTIVIDRDAKPVFQSPWGRFMTTANYDQENIGTATTGEKAIAWQSRHELAHIAPARPEQEMAWQIGKAESRFRRALSVDLKKAVGQLVKVATLLRLKGWGFHPTKQSPIITKQEGGVSMQWRQCLLGEGGDRMVPALAISDRLSRAPSPRVVEHMVQHFAAFPSDFAHRKWSVVRRYFNYDADDAPPGQYESEVKVRFEREGFVDDQPGEDPPLTKRSFEYTQRDGRHFLKLTPRTPAGDPDPRWDPVELEIYEGSWILSGAIDDGMERWIELPENRLRLYKALQGWSLGLPLLFVGEPSSGKSRLAELLQNLVGGESPQITVNKETMPHNLFYETVMGPKGSPKGVTVQKPRPILDAGLKGGACLIDEAHLLSQTMQGAFNNALSSGFYNLDGVLYRMPYLIFNMNEPDENYSALNAAFEERMDSQRFLPLSVEKIKSQLPVPEIGGELFNDRLIGEKETDDQGQVVPQRDGQPHFRGLLGVMDYIRHHPEDFPRLLYLREFNRLVLNLANNEARGLETALGQVAQGVNPWRLPQRKLFEIIRDGCRWPEGTPEQMAEWDKALINAMTDAGLWNPEAEGDPSKDGLLAFLNGEGLFIRDYPIVHTPDLEDTNLRPIRDGLLFLQRRTRGTRVQAELSNLWDHLTSLESRWASLSFSDRMTEVHVLREIHTTAGEIVKTRRAQHFPATITELERLQAGIRNFLFSPTVGWPAAALDPTIKRDPWLQRHSLPTPGQLTLDDLLGKTQVFPADSDIAHRWLQEASEILLESAREGTRLLQNNQDKGKAKNLPELAESYLEPLAALERSLRSVTDAAPGSADAVAMLITDINNAIQERRTQGSLIDQLSQRLAELRQAAAAWVGQPEIVPGPIINRQTVWTQSSLLEEEVRYLRELQWFNVSGWEIIGDIVGGERIYSIYADLGIPIATDIRRPLGCIEVVAEQAFGNNWRAGERNSTTGELVDEKQARIEAKIRWIQKKMVQVLIREGKVSVDGQSNFEWGNVSEPDINMQGTHAVIANQRRDGAVDYVIFDLRTDGILEGKIVPILSAYSDNPPDFLPIVFLNKTNNWFDPTLSDVPSIGYAVKVGESSPVYLAFVLMEDDVPRNRYNIGEVPEEIVEVIQCHTWKTGRLVVGRALDKRILFYRIGINPSGWEEWTLEMQDSAAQKGEVPYWLGDVMREAMEANESATTGISAPANLIVDAVVLGQDIARALGRAVDAITPIAQPRRTEELTREELLQDVARFLNESYWITETFTLVEDRSGDGSFNAVWAGGGTVFEKQFKDPLELWKRGMETGIVFAKGNFERNEHTLEFENEILRKQEAKDRWVQEQVIKILIREGKVVVDGETTYEWGTVSKADINIEGTYAVLANQTSAGKVDYIVLDLRSLTSESVEGLRINLSDVIKNLPEKEKLLPIVFFDNATESQNRRICFGSIAEDVPTSWISAMDLDVSMVTPLVKTSRDIQLFVPIPDNGSKLEFIVSLKGGVFCAKRNPDGSMSFYFNNSTGNLDGGWGEWDLARQETAAQSGEVPYWLGDIMRELLESEPSARPDRGAGTPSLVVSREINRTYLSAEVLNKHQMRLEKVGDLTVNPATGEVIVIVHGSKSQSNEDDACILILEETDDVYKVTHSWLLSNFGDDGDKVQLLGGIASLPDGHIVFCLQKTDMDEIADKFLYFIDNTNPLQKPLSMKLNNLIRDDRGTRKIVSITSTEVGSNGEVILIVELDEDGTPVPYRVVLTINIGVNSLGKKTISSSAALHRIGPAHSDINKGLMGDILLEILSPPWKAITNELFVNKQGGLGAPNTPPGQAPPSALDAALFLPILEEGLRPLVGIQDLHRFLTGLPGAPAEAPGLLTTLLTAVSEVITTPSEANTPARPKTNVELWRDVATFIFKLNDTFSRQTNGSNIAGNPLITITFLKTDDEGSYRLMYQLGVDPIREVYFSISDSNPLAPLFTLRDVIGPYNVSNRMLPVLLEKIHELEPLILLDLIQRGRVNLDESEVDGEIGGLNADKFSRSTKKFPGSKYNLSPDEHSLTDLVVLKDGRTYFINFDFRTCTGETINARVIKRGNPAQPMEIETDNETSRISGGSSILGIVAPELSIILERILAAVNEVSPRGNAKAKSSAQTVATRKGWISLQSRLQGWFGSVPDWLSGPLAEAVFTALREMGVYWGVLMLVSGIVGWLFSPGWWALVFAAIGVGFNWGRFRWDHPNQGRDLGFWFPFFWNLRYAGAVLVLGFGDVFLGGVALAVLGVIRHIIFDAPRLAERNKIVTDSKLKLKSLRETTIDLPSVYAEINAINSRLIPRSITFNEESIQAGKKVIDVMFGVSSKDRESESVLDYLGQRLLVARPQERADLLERYEGDVAVQASLSSNDGQETSLNWASILAPVLALREVMGLNGVPINAMVGVLFNRFVEKAKSDVSLQTDGNIEGGAPILLDISALMDPKTTQQLKDRVKERARRAAHREGVQLVVTAKDGTLDNLKEAFSGIDGLPEHFEDIFFLTPSQVAENGTIDIVRVTDILLNQTSDRLYRDAKTWEDIRFSLITDNMGRFVGLSPRQLLDLILVMPEGIVHISSLEITQFLKGLTSALSAA